MDPKNYLDANKALWNTRTGIHLDSSFYDVHGFLAGESSLPGVEVREMGEVRGKSLLHLQCHFGLDTLSLARLGASVTGVDFSEKAVESARELASRLDLAADFVCCDVLDLPAHLKGAFDIVFTSYGVLGWLPDLDRWAEVVATFLEPGGFFYIVEFHPYYYQYNESGSLTYDYFFSKQPDEEVSTTTYTDGSSHAPQKEYWWNHSLSDVINALLKQGLRLEFVNEFPFSSYKLADTMVEVGPKQYVYESLGGRIPYMFSLKARKG